MKYRYLILSIVFYSTFFISFLLLSDVFGALRDKGMSLNMIENLTIIAQNIMTIEHDRKSALGALRTGVVVFTSTILSFVACNMMSRNWKLPFDTYKKIEKFYLSTVYILALLFSWLVMNVTDYTTIIENGSLKGTSMERPVWFFMVLMVSVIGAWLASHARRTSS